MEDEDGETISANRRKALLDRVGRRTATIGQQIPETIQIGGEPFELREFVMETKSQGAIPPDKRESVRTVRNRLKQERKRRREQLEHASLTNGEAEALADVILGLDRAVTALGNLSEPNFEGRSHEAEIDGTRKWVSFVDQLTD